MAYQYPSGPDDQSAPPYNRDQFATVHRMWGSNNPDTLFGRESPTTSTPWPSAPRTKGKPMFNRELVNKELSQPPSLRSVDPRNLHSSQPGVARTHVEHYMSPEYDTTGKTSADQSQPGNAHPFVYQRSDGVNILLAGHHRAAAAVLQGRQLRARVVEE